MNKLLALTLMITAISAVGCKPSGQDNHCGATDACGDLASNDVSDVADDAVVDVDVGDILKCRDVSEADACDACVDIVIVPPRQDCWACDNSDGCKAGYECLPVGAGKYCMRRCVDDGDCLSGFVCYETGPDKICLPISYSCPGCFYNTPCDEGMCCDFNTGSCKACKNECQSCSYDYDCAAGMRCNRLDGDFTGRCIPECADGVCPDPVNQTCADNGRGLMLCVADEDYCLNGCFPPTPNRLEDGTCVECADVGDCDADECCDSNTHVCKVRSCPEYLLTCDSCECAQHCCTDADCLLYPEVSGKCLVEADFCDGPWACGLCSADFPWCALIDGVEQCVQCRVDADCAAVSPGCMCTGDPFYACVDEAGAICQKEGSCQSMCTNSEDCPPSSIGTSLWCDVTGETSFCYDPAGSCDGSSACCAPGQKCFDLVVLMFGVMGGSGTGIDIPERTSAYCSCNDDNECNGGNVCLDMSVLCLSEGSGAAYRDFVCPDGQLSPSFPPRLCAPLEVFFAGFDPTD